MIETVLILNSIIIMTNTTVLLVVLYKIGTKVFNYEFKKH